MTRYIFDGDDVDIDYYMKTGKKEKISKKEQFWTVVIHLIFWTIIFLAYWIPLRVLNPIVVP